MSKDSTLRVFPNLEEFQCYQRNKVFEKVEIPAFLINGMVYNVASNSCAKELVIKGCVKDVSGSLVRSGGAN